jgi:hypothetical protein
MFIYGPILSAYLWLVLWDEQLAELEAMLSL